MNFKTVVKIVDTPLILDDVLKEFTEVSTGAICMFTGVVRGKTNREKGQVTSALEYEAYIPMAEQKLAQIAEEIREKWHDVQGIGILQRIGYLEVGEASVLIVCTASHRDMGVFEAARYGIDRLKEIVPVWKKEINPDGGHWVEGDYFPEPGD